MSNHTPKIEDYIPKVENYIQRGFSIKETSNKLNLKYGQVQHIILKYKIPYKPLKRGGRTFDDHADEKWYREFRQMEQDSRSGGGTITR